MRMDGLLSPSNLCRTCVLGLILTMMGCNATSGWAMNRAGMKHYKRGNYAQARQEFARAIADDRWNPDYRYNLAMSLRQQGDAAAAERILRHNLTINAMHQPTYHSLAQMLNTQGRTAEAEDLLAGWAESQPYVAESNVELAFLQRETGNVTAAEQSLQNALRANPTHPTALAHLGQIYQESGRGDLAIAYYQRSLAAKWDQPEVQSRLATLVEPGTISRNTRRSAMMQNSLNPPMMAGGPGLATSPVMASSAPMNPEAELMAQYGMNADPRARFRRQGRTPRDQQVVAAYPLPDFTSQNVVGLPEGMTDGQSTVFVPPTVVSDPSGVPQMADVNYSPAPVAAMNPPTLVPQADPAHFGEAASEMTASIPVVEPH